MSPRVRTLKAILNSASKRELKGLTEIIGSPSDTNVDKIINDMHRIGLSAYEYHLEYGDTLPYKFYVQRVAKKMGISYNKKDTVSKLEAEISKAVLNIAVEKMNDKQILEFEKELQKVAKKEAKGFGKTSEVAASIGTFSALTAAQLSGFGIYLAASTALGFVTGVLGIALPFAVYTAMSGTIALVIGPVGWVAAGILTLMGLTGPNYKKLVAFVIFVSVLRNKSNQ